MKHSLRLLFAIAVALTALPAGMYAHFQLLQPTSWVTEDQRGDPQKLGPCGGDPKGQNDPLLTGVVSKVTGGSRLHIKIQETIYHSGHYRVALAVNSRTELPPLRTRPISKMAGYASGCRACQSISGDPCSRAPRPTSLISSSSRARGVAACWARCSPTSILMLTPSLENSRAAGP